MLGWLGYYLGVAVSGGARSAKVHGQMVLGGAVLGATVSVVRLGCYRIGRGVEASPLVPAVSTHSDKASDVWSSSRGDAKAGARQPLGAQVISPDAL